MIIRQHHDSNNERLEAEKAMCSNLSMKITPMILTFNEEPNIGRTLQRLSWASDIVIIDSGSTDSTVEIAKKWPQVRVVTRAFDTFADQCNFGLEQIESDWVLSLDADYVLSAELEHEIQALVDEPNVAGYSARFTYCVWGRPLRASLYPPRTVLYRKSKAVYLNDGHGHKVKISGHVRMLNSAVLHDDRKPLDRWLAEQVRYSHKESSKLLSTEPDELNLPDRLRRRTWCAPLLVLAYTLFAKGLILDGWAGWYYAFQRVLAEILLSLRLLEQKLR
jgi:glycosyltransferase involved in cell wall biosynthesis